MNLELAYGVIAFLLGSVPFGMIVARLFHIKDPRHEGSGNIGATNVTRIAGFWPAGFLTFLLDFLKGLFPVLLISFDGFRQWLGYLTGHEIDGGMNYIWFVGFLAVAGHCFSPWLRFRGGKGVSTGLGVMLVLSPISFVIAALLYLVVFAMTEIGSLSSLFAIGGGAIGYLVLHPYGPHVWGGALMVGIIFLRHESNIDGLLERKERAFR